MKISRKECSLFMLMKNLAYFSNMQYVPAKIISAYTYLKILLGAVLIYLSPSIVESSKYS